MKREIYLYVKDILEYMERSEKHIKDINYENFLTTLRHWMLLSDASRLSGRQLKTFLMISGINTLLFHGATCQE